jgi:outer membrane protein
MPVMAHVLLTCWTGVLKTKRINVFFMKQNQTITGICILLLATGLNCFSQTAATKYSLKQCIEQALANNIPVKQTGLQVETAGINLQQSKTDRLPNLNGSWDFGFNRGRSVDPQTNGYINQQLSSSNTGLSSGLIVFNGMRLKNLIQQNNFSYEAAKMDAQQAKDNLTLNVILAYLLVLNNEDVLEITKGQLEVTKKQVERTGILIKEGSGANYLLTDLKGQLANEEINLINLNTALQQSRLSLCQLMNIAFNPALQLERINLETPLLPYTVNAGEVYQTAVTNLALVKANAFKVQSAEKAIKVAQGSVFPVLRFNGNLGSNYSSLAKTLTPTNITEENTGAYVKINSIPNPVLTQQQNFSAAKTGYTKQLNNNLGTFVGVNLQIPVFNSFQTKNRVKLATITFKNSQLEADNTKLILQQNIEQAHLNSTSAYERYAVLQEQVKNLEESFRAAEVRFNSGVINAPEYLIAKNNLDRAKTNWSQTRYEYIFRTKILDFYQGKLSW